MVPSASTCMADNYNAQPGGGAALPGQSAAAGGFSVLLASRTRVRQSLSRLPAPDSKGLGLMAADGAEVPCARARETRPRPSDA